MAYVGIVAALAVLELVWFGILVGRARGQYNVEAPATTGHPIFERHFRVQQNTIEQMVIFLPGLYLFARFVSEPIAALIGLVYVVGRVIYQRSYVADPATRSVGFALSALPALVLVVG